MAHSAISVLSVTAFFVAATCLSGGCADRRTPLRVSADNGRYVTDGCGPIYLAGSQTWRLIVDDPSHPGSTRRAEDFADWLASWGHNYTRTWSGWSYLSVGLLPWNRTGPGMAADGRPKVDLASYNEEYFRRLRFQVQALADRGIYTSVMLFGSFNAMRNSDTYAANVAWHPDNNINGLGLSPTDGTSFFDLENPALLAVQEAHVRRMIDALNDLDTIVWEVMNEPRLPESLAWQEHMAGVVRRYEAAKPKQHLVVLSGGYDEAGTLLEGSNADIISPTQHPNNYFEGGPADFDAKVVLADTDHLWGYSQPSGADDYRRFVWKAFLRGKNVLFMDNYDNTAGSGAGVIDPVYDPVRRALGDTVAFARRLDLKRTVPVPEAASTGYCLADAGRAYLVYQPAAGDITLHELPPGDYACQWFDPRLSTIVSCQTIRHAGGSRTFSPPIDGDAVLYLTATPPRR